MRSVTNRFQSVLLSTVFPFCLLRQVVIAKPRFVYIDAKRGKQFYINDFEGNLFT